MRNFKKFLALVLAMLMVSACAVSVSAAFNDQAAIDATDFEDAVEILAELGVVKGDENQNFNPNNTLRRDEAAVIIAKLVAGIAGQSMDWTAATTKFADVDAAWSFAYINYVADRKIMVGSNIGFEPTRELQIDEALALALKAADPAAVRNVEIMNAQYPTNYWATYYISAAEELGLADNLGIIYDHEAACSRAMFAQIAVNMLNNSAIGTAFGYQTIDGYITSVDADNNKLFLNTLGEKAINLAAFNATLAEAGYDKVAADMIDYKVSMQWSNKTGEIFEIDVLSSVDTYNYTDAAIKYVPDPDDSNKVLAKKLELNGKVYDINADDYRYDEDDVSDVIGGTLADDLNNIRFYDVNNHNEITTVVKDATIPAFYEVACFDDDADGDYERAYVTTYDLVTLTKGDEIDHDENGDTAKVNATKVTVFGKDVTSTHALSGQYLTVDGAAYTAWGETPVLVYLVDGDKATMTGKILETADKVTGVVTSIAPNEIAVDIGTKHAGYVPLSELTDDPNAKTEDIVNKGDELELLVVRVNDVEGTVMLSKKRLDAQAGFEKVMNAVETGEILEGVVTEVIKGGVLALTNGVKVFIPASQATMSRGEDLNGLLKKTVQFKILEVNRQRRRAVGSIRVVAREARKVLEEKFWNEVEVGAKFTGTVKSLTDYGAFVDLGGVDGMVHISELSWSKVRHPSQVVSIGDVIDVFVKDIDAEKKKISLGYKKDEDNPWEILRKNYEVGQAATVKIVSLTDFGAFAEIIPGIDGLIHISQISRERVGKPADVLSIGQQVEAKLTELDFERRRVSLSIRALLDDAAKAEAEAEAPVEE